MTIKFRGLTSNADGKKAEYFIDGKVFFRLFPHKAKDKEIIERFRQIEKSGKLPSEWTTAPSGKTASDTVTGNPVVPPNTAEQGGIPKTPDNRMEFIAKDHLKFSVNQWGKIAEHFGIAADALTLGNMELLRKFYAEGNKISGLGESFQQSLDEQMAALIS